MNILFANSYNEHVTSRVQKVVSDLKILGARVPDDAKIVCLIHSDYYTLYPLDEVKRTAKALASGRKLLIEDMIVSGDEAYLIGLAAGASMARDHYFAILYDEAG